MPDITMLLIAFFCVVAASAISHREHKVHNIVLYPDKQSWCKTTAIKQVVGMPGYSSVTIDNHVCVGACFSYSIPSSEPAEPGELIRPYCDSCQPVKTRCYHVTLHKDPSATTTTDDSDQLPETRQKRVQIIDECACQKCIGFSGSTTNSLEEDDVDTDCEAAERRTSELPEQLLSAGSGSRSAEEENDESSTSPSLNEENVSQVAPKVVHHHKSGGHSHAPDSVLLGSDSGSSQHLGADSTSEDVSSSSQLINTDHLDNPHLRQLLLARHRQWALGKANSVNTLDDGEDDDDEDEVTHAEHLDHVFAKGPHGSLVLVPAERVTVDEKDMRPAHEDTVIEYSAHTHHKKDDKINTRHHHESENGAVRETGKSNNENEH